MNPKLFFITLTLILGSVELNAQQIFRISQFNQHNFMHNPAAAGAAQFGSVGGAYRKMWQGMPGGPQTSILYFDKYFSGKKAGLALVVYDDKTGPTSRTGGELNISYSIEMNNGSRLMFGLAGHVLQYRIDKEEMAKYIPGDPLLAGPGSQVAADAAAGIYYNGKNLHLGVSAKQLIQSKLDMIQGNTNPEGRLYRHYYFTGDYNVRTDEDNVLIPNVVVRYLPNAPIDVEGGLRLEHKDFIWVGFKYQHEQNIGAYAGFKIDHKLAIGYGCDIYKTPISIFDDGGLAHEFTLRYFFTK